MKHTTKSLQALTILALIMMVMGSQQLSAQTVSLLTFTGYTFQDKINYSGGYGQIDDAFQWGGGLEFSLPGESKAFNLIYQQLDTKASIRSNNFATESGKVGFHYIMGGVTHFQPLGASPVHGFAAVDLGACIISPKDRPDLNNATKFAWGLRLGLGGGENVKFRVYGQLYSPVQSAGAGLYFGTGGGGAGVSTYSTIYQFGVGASLAFVLKEM